jgi:hypothetical protein
MEIIKRKRGISPVLTVLLLIAVSVGSALITQIWVVTYVDSTMSKVEHVIWIPSVHFREESSTIAITIYVQNIQEGTVQLTQVYINEAMVREEDMSMSESGFIEESETCTITVINQLFEKDEEIRIKVVSIDGVSTEGAFQVVI